MAFELVHSRCVIDRKKDVRVDFYKDTGSIEDLDGTHLRQALCFYYVYGGLEMGSGMYFVSFKPYKYKRADGKDGVDICPTNIILPIKTLATYFSKNQPRDVARLGSEHFVAGYHVGNYVSDLKEAFAFYCKSQLDLVKERTGIDWSACIDFTDCRHDVALTKLIEMEGREK